MSALPPGTTSESAPRLWRAGTLTYTTGGLALLFLWLLWGDFAWAMRERAIPTTVQLLFKRFGASDTLVGILFSSLPAAIGLVLGPVIGYRSDRLRSRWGRRIPFLVVPIPFIVVSIVGLGFAPQIGAFLERGPASDGKLTLYLLSGFWVLFEISCVAANGVFFALINDVVPAPMLGRFFGLFRAASLGAGIFVNYWLIGKAETHYVWICLGIALLYGVGFTLMCLKVKEGAHPPPPAASEEETGLRMRKGLPAVRSYFRECFSHSYYVLAFAVAACCALSTLPFGIYSVFYAKSLGMGMDTYGKCMALTLTISLGLSYPLGALVDRWHPLRTSIAVIALYGFLMAWGFVEMRSAASFAVLLVAQGVLSGCYYTSSASLLMRLFPKEKFAELYSASTVVSGLVAMAIPAILGPILDASGHQYRYIFPMALALAALGVGGGCLLYRRFLLYGGPARYVPPSP
ncbi:MAG TPA: MFS transporter [Candidatus Methylacidiphilales bacterium]